MLFSLGRIKSVGLLAGAGSPSPVAVDLGVAGIKALQVTTGDSPQLIAAACLPTPEELLEDPNKRLAFQFAALPRVLKAGGFRGKRAICSIPAGQMFCKHLQIPRSDNVDVEHLVQAATSQAVGCLPEALIYRHVVVEEAQAPSSSSGGGAKQEVISLATSRELIAKTMDAVRAAKLELVGIQPEFLATLQSFYHINRRTSDQEISTLYLDMGAGTTKVGIAHGPSLVFAKVVQFGGRELDQAAARELNCTIREARQRRLEADAFAPAADAQGNTTTVAKPKQGLAAIDAAIAAQGDLGPADSGIMAAVVEDQRTSALPTPGLTEDVREQPAAPSVIDLVEPLEQLVDEVAMCIRYYETIFPGRKVNRAIFFGGEARHRALCQHVARALRLPAQVADPLARIARTGTEKLTGVDVSTPQPGWAVAVGLALGPTDL